MEMVWKGAALYKNHSGTHERPALKHCIEETTQLGKCEWKLVRLGWDVHRTAESCTAWIALRVSS